MIPDARVHWIGNRPYFGVVMLYPSHGQHVKWLWQLYDQVGKKLGKGRVPRKHDALVAIRHFAHERGKEDMKKDELMETMTEKCLNCGGEGSVEESDTLDFSCPACGGEGRL